MPYALSTQRRRRPTLPYLSPLPVGPAKAAGQKTRLLAPPFHLTSCDVTVDMSGGWKRAKHAGNRPLNGRVSLHTAPFMKDFSPHMPM
jgi:hypothetical protein